MSERPDTYIHKHDRTHLLSSMKSPSTYNHQHDRRHLLSSMERPFTYNWSCGSQSHSHIRKSLNLHLIMWEPIPQSYQNGYVLTYDHVGANPTVISEWLLHLTMEGTNPITMSEGICTYIWPCKELIQHTCQKGSILTSDHVGTHPIVTWEWLLHLYLIMWENIPHSYQNGSQL